MDLRLPVIVKELMPKFFGVQRVDLGVLEATAPRVVDVHAPSIGQAWLDSCRCAPFLRATPWIPTVRRADDKADRPDAPMRCQPHIQHAAVPRVLFLLCSLVLLAACGAEQIVPSLRASPSSPSSPSSEGASISTAPPVPTPVPSADLVGVIHGAPDTEGGICPVILQDDAGERWEVYLGSGYRHAYQGEVIVIITPDDEITARSGDRVGFNINVDESLGSFCMVGIPVTATDIVFVQRRDN